MSPPLWKRPIVGVLTQFSRGTRYVIFLFLLFVALGVGLHGWGFGSAMIYDSKAGIEDKAQFFSSRDVRDIMGLVPGRPLFMLTLYGNFLLTGTDPWYLRLTSAVMLAATGVMLALLTHALLLTPAMANRGTDTEKWIIAAMVGALCVIHPLQSFVVLYVWQRQALLACFFALASLTLYVRARSGRSPRPLLADTGTGVLFLAGLLTKESAVSLPAMLVLAELVFFPGHSRHFGRRIATVALISLPALLAYGLVNRALQGPATVHTQGVVNLLLDNYRMAQLTVPEVAATQCRVLCSYFRMVVAPFVGDFSLVKAEIISRSLWNPPSTAAAVLGMMALSALGIGLTRRRPLAAFGLLFFIITAIPEGMLSPQYLFFGYRPVLFMVGLLLVMGEFADCFLFRVQKRVVRNAAAIGLCAWAACIAAVTVDQARQWNPLGFWQRAFDQLPELSKDTERKIYEDILINYGDQLIRTGRYGEAVAVLEKAVRINPRLALPHTKLALAHEKSGAGAEALQSYRRAVAALPRSSALRANLGEALIRAGDTAEGIEALREAVALDPRDESARIRLGTALISTQSVEQGITHLSEAVKANPSSSAARFHLGVALHNSGKTAQAIEQYREAVKRDPRFTIAYAALGLALEAEGRIPGAQESFRKALALDPRSADASYYLANCLMKTGDLEESIAYFRKALELRPDFPDAEANFGTVLLSTGRVEEAVRYLEKALVHIRDNAELHNALAAALAEQGREGEAIRHFKRALEIDAGHAAAKQNLENITRQTGK